MDLKLLPLYFIIGGLVVSSVTYFGSQGKGTVAAFIALLPSVSVLTLITIYAQGGAPAATSYARNLLLLSPIWILYVAAILLLLPRIGLAGSLMFGVAIYVVAAFIVMKLT